MKIKSTGTQADLAGKVEISKVHGGYFSNPVNAQAFVDIGIKPILNQLPSSGTYADFGGGEGYLGKFVQEALITYGKSPRTTIIDANPSYLEKAKNLGLETLCENLQDCSVEEMDLITMRAVNHYNPLEQQSEILSNALKNLKEGGFLISQISTGNEENVSLRSAICNLPSLGRAAKNDSYCWVSEETYFKMLKKCGFSKIQLMGYAPDNSWSTPEQWNRFNSAKMAEAIEDQNIPLINEIEKRKNKFFKDCAQLLTLFDKNEASVEEESRGDYRIDYKYAIIKAKK